MWRSARSIAQRMMDAFDQGSARLRTRETVRTSPNIERLGLRAKARSSSRRVPVLARFVVAVSAGESARGGLLEIAQLQDFESADLLRARLGRRPGLRLRSVGPGARIGRSLPRLGFRNVDIGGSGNAACCSYPLQQTSTGRANREDAPAGHRESSLLVRERSSGGCRRTASGPARTRESTGGWTRRRTTSAPAVAHPTPPKDPRRCRRGVRGAMRALVIVLDFARSTPPASRRSDPRDPLLESGDG